MSKELKVANCRGKLPVLKDISKCIEALDKLDIELNDCDGKENLKKARFLLFNTIFENGYELSNKYHPILRK